MFINIRLIIYVNIYPFYYHSSLLEAMRRCSSAGNTNNITRILLGFFFVFAFEISVDFVSNTNLDDEGRFNEFLSFHMNDLYFKADLFAHDVKAGG